MSRLFALALVFAAAAATARAEEPEWSQALERELAKVVHVQPRAKPLAEVVATIRKQLALPLFLDIGSVKSERKVSIDLIKVPGRQALTTLGNLCEFVVIKAAGHVVLTHPKRAARFARAIPPRPAPGPARTAYDKLLAKTVWLDMQEMPAPDIATFIMQISGVSLRTDITWATRPVSIMAPKKIPCLHALALTAASARTELRFQGGLWRLVKERVKEGGPEVSAPGPEER